jgi:hypothetical protein
MNIREWWQNRESARIARRIEMLDKAHPVAIGVPLGDPQELTREEAERLGIPVPAGATGVRVYGATLKALEDARGATEAFRLGLQHDVSEWFELTYAHYLTVPRSILEAMPLEWQRRFTACLDELDETFDWRPKKARYFCFLRNRRGRFLSDPLHDYRRPDLHYIASLKRERETPKPDGWVPSSVYRPT